MIAFTALSTLALALCVKAAPVNFAAAAYTITNEPSGNYVLATYITSSGTMAYGSATSAEGKGAHGNSTGGDALYSQGSVQVWGDYLFTVNAGSNTVVMFRIDASDPGILHMLGSPVSSGGDFPVSVAVSSEAEVCVLNSGKVAGVSCYWATSAGLWPIPGTIRSLPTNQTTPPAGPGDTASDIVFNPSGNELLVVVKGTPPSTPGYLATWAINSDGSLAPKFTKSSVSAPGLLPFSLTKVNGVPNAYLSADPANGYDIWDMTKTIPTSTGFTVSGQAAICWSAYSSKTDSYFLIDAGASLVTEVTITDPTHSSIVKQYTLASGSGPLDSVVATIGGQDFLIILATAKTGIDILALPGRGAAHEVASLNITAIAPSSVQITATNLEGMGVWVA